MDSLTICILTLNEEKSLPRLLSQLKEMDINKEVLVIDSYSTDRTLEIIGENKWVRMVQHPFVSHAKQRNYAVSQAKGEWLLMIDADEILSDELVAELKTWLNADKKSDIYDIPRKNYFFGQWIQGTWPDYQRRLFRKSAGFEYSNEIHETISTEKEVGKFRHHIEHLTEGYGMEEWVRKMNSYTKKGAQQKGKTSMIKLLVEPIYSALLYYIWQKGWKDGKAGIIYAIMVYAYSFVEHAKRIEAEITESNKTR